MSDETLSYNEPHDELTAIAGTGVDAAGEVADGGDRIIVLVTRADGEGVRCGVAVWGYEGEPGEEAVSLLTDLLIQTKGVARAYGKDVLIAPLRKG